MSLPMRHGMQLNQSSSSSLKLKQCYTCLRLDRNLRPLEAQNKYLLAMLCPKMFSRAKYNVQYHICWECEFMIVKIKRFQARLIKACVTQEVTTTAEGLSTLKLTGVEIIDIPPPMVSTDQPMLGEMLIAPLKLDTETMEIKIEREESGDYHDLIRPSIIQEESNDESTDTASETDMLMNDDPLLTPIQKKPKKCVKIKVPPQKAVKNAIIAPNQKVNYRLQKEKPAQAYREPVKVIIGVPNLITNKESVPNLVKGKGSVPIAVKDKMSDPIIVNDKVSNSDLARNKGSIPNLRKAEQSIPIIKRIKEGIFITQSVSSSPNPPRETVEPDSEQKLGLYGYEEDEVKCKILNRTELNTYRDKRGSIFKGCKYKCDRCVEIFKSQEKLDEHNKKHDNSRGTSICEVCEQRFPDENVRNEHYKQHFIIFECLKCQYQNYDRLQISEHIRRKHEVSSFYCRKCNAVFKTYQEKRKHLVHVHGKRRSCEECNKTFLTLSQLKWHLANSHRTETTECPICKKKVRKNYLATHMKNTHNDTREDSAYCVVCEKTFKSQQSYKKHLKTSLKHNTVEQIGIKCDHCNKYFSSTMAMKDHVEEINGVRYKCHICNKESKNKKILARHIRVIHMGQKPRMKQRICEYCGKSFSIKRSLEQHINKHLGHRPLVCKDCGATFIYSAALFTHRRLVHKVKRKYEMTS